MWNRNIGLRRQTVGRISLTQNSAEPILQLSRMGKIVPENFFFEPFYSPDLLLLPH